MRIRKKVWMTDEEPILVIMAILLVLGTINVFSSSYVLATTDFDDPYYFLLRHICWLILSCAACFALSRLNYHRLQSPAAKWGLTGVVVLLLALVLGVGTVVNGARRWISLGGFSLQPAELAKLVGILLCASPLADRLRSGQKATVLAKEYAILLVMAYLVEKEPDGGTMAIIVAVPLAMAFIAGLRPLEWKALGAGIILGAIGLIFGQSYRLERMKIMLDPWSDAQGTGYQTVQSLSTIGSGGFLGMGLGDGVSKYDYLPEAHTDFAFAIFSQEHGYIGALLVFLLFIFLIFCCVRVANRARDTYGQLLACGIMILVAGQAAGNLIMVGGMFAVVGVPLPFISYGGSSLIVTMCAMGILLNISRHGITREERKELEERKLAAELAAVEQKRAAMHLVK